MSYRFSKKVHKIMKTAEEEAQEMGNNYIGSEHILLGILKDPSSDLSKILASQGVFYFQIKDDLMVLFGMKEQEKNEVAMTQVVEDILERSMRSAVESNLDEIDDVILTKELLETKRCVANELLIRYEVDVSEIVRSFRMGGIKELDHLNELRNLNTSYTNNEIVGREKEIEFMMHILCRKEKANPLLIGDAGVGKTAMVEKLACMIANHEVPKALENTIIYELNLNSLVAGTKYRGDFEEKLQKLIRLIEVYPNVILFVDEIHQMIGAGKSEGSIDVASVLKPYLARGVLKCIGATTNDEYEAFLEKDRALERRFQTIVIKEPNKEETQKMLLAKKGEYETYHGVVIKNEIMKQIVDYCDYYLGARKFPDKAMDVLDLACVVGSRQNKLVDETSIKEVIELMSGIQIYSKDRITHVKEYLGSKIFGQNEVIEKISNQLHWMEQQVDDRPLGVWLFLGENGVGKKSLAKEFNKAYFNQEQIVELDLSNIDAHFDAFLMKMKRNPYTCVYLHHLEQANPNVIHLFTQGMKKGWMEYQNKRIDLRHSVFIYNGNFTLSNSTLHFKEAATSREQLSKYLGEHFMNCVDEVFHFETLEEPTKVKIIQALSKRWDQSIDETTIMNVVRSQTTVSSAYKELRRQYMGTKERG